MASSSATPQTAAKTFQDDPEGVCKGLLDSVTKIGAELKDDDAKAKNDWKEAVDDLNKTINKDWAGFCGNPVNATRAQTMETAAAKITKAAGKLDTLLTNSTANAKITMLVSLIKSSAKTLTSQVASGRLAQRVREE